MPEEGIHSGEAALPSFVELLVPDPGKPPSCRYCSAFLAGASMTNLCGSTSRLPWTITSRPGRQSVVHSQRLEEVLPKATIMWPPRDARVVHGPLREPGPRIRG